MEMSDGSSQALQRLHLVGISAFGICRDPPGAGAAQGAPGHLSPPWLIAAVPEPSRSLRSCLWIQAILSGWSDSVHIENPNYCMQNQLKAILPSLRLSALHPGKTGIAQQFCLPALLHVHPSPSVPQDNNDHFHRASLPVSHFSREIIRWAKSKSIGNINSGKLKAQGENSDLMH